jgi:hypothetical protein
LKSEEDLKKLNEELKHESEELIKKIKSLEEEKLCSENQVVESKKSNDELVSSIKMFLKILPDFCVNSKLV